MGNEPTDSAPVFPSASDLRLVRPAEAKARGQLEDFLAALDSSVDVDRAFLGGLADEGESGPRTDLVSIAESRMKVWGPDDAVTRTFEIVDWFCREVLCPYIPWIEAPTPRTFDESAALAKRLAPVAKEAGDTWYEQRHGDGVETPFWQRYQLLSLLERALRELELVRRRAVLTKYLPKPPSRSRPAYLCAEVAKRCGQATTYACELEPSAASALHRLGLPEFSVRGRTRRAQEALYAVGVTQFGARLEAFSVAMVDAFDAATSSGVAKGSQILAAVEAAVPVGADAASAVVESPQLVSRPIPAGSTTFEGAAVAVLERLVGEVVAHLHVQGGAIRAG